MLTQLQTNHLAMAHAAVQINVKLLAHATILAQVPTVSAVVLAANK
jgi:hypothetical protein